jgi:hypothetical protein
MRQFLLAAAASVLGLALATPAYADDGYKEYLERLKEHHKRQREWDKKQQKRVDKYYRELAKREAELYREQRKRYEEYRKDQAKWYKGGKGHSKKGWRYPAPGYYPDDDLRPLPPARVYPGWRIEPRYGYPPPHGWYILPPDREDDEDD